MRDYLPTQFGITPVSSVEVRFSIGERGAAVDVPACPTLGVVLSSVGNSLDSWFLTTLEEAVRAVLAGEVPEYGVNQDELGAEVKPDRVRAWVCDDPPDSIPTRDCAAVLVRWRAHLTEIATRFG